MSLQRNSALSMRTICFSKPVTELVLQTGLTRPRSWTEEVSDLGRGLFSFEFPAQIETSASRETNNKTTIRNIRSLPLGQALICRFAVFRRKNRDNRRLHHVAN
jgi:hypothetical protein